MTDTRVVAYRSLGGRILRCLNHIPPEPDGDFVRVTSGDLPDGGVCTYPGCGVDVLIPPFASRSDILRDAADKLWALANRLTERGQGVLWAAGRLRRMADEVQPSTEVQASVTLTSAERKMLTFALDEAQEKIWSQDGFTDEDQAAVDSLRRLVRAPDSTQGVSSEAQQRLARAREIHRQTCLLARGEVKPTAFTCGMCEALGEPVDL